MRVQLKAGVGVALGVLLGGCVMHSVAGYPGDWAARSAVAKSQCPNLAGRYRNVGEMAAGTAPLMCQHGHRYRFRATWQCDMALSRNVADVPADDWVELRQPDADTLLVVSSDPAVDVKVLHRSSGDFSCSEGGLERRLRASTLSIGNDAPNEPKAAATFNGIETLYGAAMGFGGIRTLTRSFRAAADGSLTMDVTIAESDLVFLVPTHLKDETFVRWTRIGDAAAGEPAATAASADPAAVDAPYHHFARFQSMGGFIYHVRLTSVDGDHVGEGKPIPLAPGSHWLEVGMIDHSIHGWVDFDTAYGFELEAAEGHTYRLAQRPERCLPEGKVTDGLASHAVLRTRLALTDEAPRGEPRNFSVEGLCIAGTTLMCDASTATAGSDGMSCVHLEGNTRGYWGRNALER